MTPKKPTGLLGRDAILEALDLPDEEVPVPEWGGSVRVRAMAAEDYLDYSNADRDTVVKAVVALVAVSVVDAQGARLFTLADVEALAKKNMKALNRVFTVATRLSAQITGAAAEETEKN